MSQSEQGLSPGQIAHEGALIFWPGYDLGTCVSAGDCSGGEWVIGVIGVIPGGKSVALGGKGVVKAGTTVLGKVPDYIGLADELGAKRFNIPTDVWNKMTRAEQWAANQKFLDRLIQRGDNIVLSNPVKNLDEVSGTYRRELDYLLERGYRFGDDGATLIRAGGG